MQQQQCRDDRHGHSEMMILLADLLFARPVAWSNTIWTELVWKTVRHVLVEPDDNNTVLPVIETVIVELTIPVCLVNPDYRTVAGCKDVTHITSSSSATSYTYVNIMEESLVSDPSNQLLASGQTTRTPELIIVKFDFSSNLSLFFLSRYDAVLMLWSGWGTDAYLDSDSSCEK